MNTEQNTTKKIMHISCSLLIIFIMLLSVINFFLPKLYSLDSLRIGMIAFNSAFYLSFSIAFLIMGVLLPKEDKKLSSKTKRNLFIIELITGFMKGEWTIHLHGKNKTIRRQWNAIGIFISSIFLLSSNLFTILVVADSRDYNIGYILHTMISTPYGQILLAQFFGWILLNIAAFVWYYIDMKSRIQVPEEVKNMKQGNIENVQCCHCVTVYKYNLYNGICPKCHKYNQPSYTFYNENSYKKKKALLELFKTIGLTILIFTAVIIITLIKNYVD